MKPLHSPTSKSPGRPISGFSLVEVTLALGIMAFCMIPLLGLLPTGLDAQRKAQESARAAVAMNLLSTAIRSAQFVSRDPTSGVAKYNLPKFFSDDGTQTQIKEGDAASTRVYAILENGSIGTPGNAAARQTMFVQTFPPATSAQLTAGGTITPSPAIRVYAYITWPALPSDTATMPLSAIKNRQGAVEGFVTYVPSN